jgi:hypothetical protein
MTQILRLRKHLVVKSSEQNNVSACPEFRAALFPLWSPLWSHGFSKPLLLCTCPMDCDYCNYSDQGAVWPCHHLVFALASILLCLIDCPGLQPGKDTVHITLSALVEWISSIPENVPCLTKFIWIQLKCLWSPSSTASPHWKADWSVLFH